jgi:hypothetical protein
MKPLVLAAYCVFAMGGFLGLVAAAAAIGRRAEHTDEFSWVRYAAFVACAAGLEAAIALAPAPWMVALAFALLAAVALVRAAFDAQTKTFAEKAGFLQLYAALLVAQVLLLHRAGGLSGARASAWLSFEIHDHLGHLLLPLPQLARFGAELPGFAEPSSVAFAIGSAFAGHVLLVLALSTFALSAFAYAHFAEHATPNVGLSLLPAPSVATVLFVTVAVLSRVLAAPLRALPQHAELFLAPYFVAEGLWVVHRMARRLRTRGAWTALLAATALVVPGVAFGLAALGVVFHLVRLRAFQPVLGDLERSAFRPRIGAALGAMSAATLVFVVLALFDRAALARLSPALESAPAVCGNTTLTPEGAGVRFENDRSDFVIDADETSLVPSGPAAAERLCAAHGARLCTSDEWVLACVCSYPNESTGGPKITTNPRLTYRVAAERATPSPDRHVRGLLTGESEVVAGGTNGEVLLAGSSSAVADSWAEDCRYRGRLTEGALEGGASGLIAARCCR